MRGARVYPKDRLAAPADRVRRKKFGPATRIDPQRPLKIVRRIVDDEKAVDRTVE